jgi:hypothetical protein
LATLARRLTIMRVPGDHGIFDPACLGASRLGRSHVRSTINGDLRAIPTSLSRVVELNGGSFAAIQRSCPEIRPPARHATGGSDQSAKRVNLVEISALARGRSERARRCVKQVRDEIADGGSTYQRQKGLLNHGLAHSSPGLVACGIDFLSGILHGFARAAGQVRGFGPACRETPCQPRFPCPRAARSRAVPRRGPSACVRCPAGLSSSGRGDQCGSQPAYLRAARSRAAPAAQSAIAAGTAGLLGANAIGKRPADGSNRGSRVRRATHDLPEVDNSRGNHP